jgi:glyoxalase-like protein
LSIDMSQTASPASATARRIEPVLDHVVINVLDKLDEAATQYARLGFQLTERGHHSLGSSNNLAIFHDNYLELLGYLPGREQKRKDLWHHPAGLTGLVFKSIDPDVVYASMQARHVPVDAPLQFGRPVALPEGTRDARFAVVRVAGDAVQNGRTFFCHHYTPDLVYRGEWQAHPNGVITISDFVIAAREPARTAALYDSMFGPGLLQTVDGGVAFRAGAATVSILTPAAIAARYADAAPKSADGSDRMVALGFKVRALGETRSLLGRAGVTARELPGGGIVVPHQDAANAALAFRE